MRALALLFLLTGCATGGLHTQFVADEKLKFDASKYPDDAAVVLYRSDKTELVEDGSDAYVHNLRHEVIAVQSEGGFDVAEVRVPFLKAWKLVDFRARVVQPDGSQKLFDGSQMLTDAGGKGETDVNAKFFRFPDVRIGSVLEYAWVVESPGLWNADEQDTLGVFPVREYQFELTAMAPLVLETIEFNGGSPIQVRSLADGRHQLLFELKDLPRRKKADFAPHWTFSEPRWAWRVLGYKTRAYTVDWLRTWDDVIEGRAKQFFVDQELEKGLELPLDVSGCSDLTCKAARALSVLGDRTVSRGVKWDRAEKLTGALNSGKASVVERALLLKFLLEREGADVWLAYGTGKLAQQTSPTFPRLGQFDHLFVHLPVQPGVPQALTIDAACDSCAPGQIAAEYQGTPIYVFKAKPELSKVAVTGRWASLNQDDAPVQSLIVSHRAKVEASGLVRDDCTVKTTGLWAEESLERKNNEHNAKTSLKQREFDALIPFMPMANVQKATWGECGKKTCEYQSELTFGAEVIELKPRLLVPTTFLRAFWENQFEAPERELDVHFAQPENIDETVELTVPEGLELTEAPKPVSIKLSELSVDVTVEKTPKGAKLHRVIKRGVGVVSRNDYAELRQAIEAFRRGRRQVLVFAPRK
jgi:Domain of Unknown Function with PDB structure (DUF3857)